MTRRLWLPLLSLCLVVLAACSSAQPPTQASPSGSESASPTPRPSVVAPHELAVGDCTGPISGTEVTEIPLVDCALEHNYEVFAGTELTGDAYPGLEEVKRLGLEFCAPEFKTFIGTDDVMSSYQLVRLVPLDQLWAANKSVRCLAGTRTGGITGTLRDKQKGQATADAALLPPIGTCTGSLDDAGRVNATPCKEPHQYEVYARKVIEDKTFPGAAKLRDLASSFCTKRFETYIGIPANQSKYKSVYLATPQERWASLTERALVCLVGTPGGEITGTLRNTKK